MTRFATEDGAFEIDSLPSQCQVGICHGFYVNPDKRRQGLAHGLKQEQNEVLSGLGYDYGLCTVAESNSAQKAVLDKAGWRYLDSFFSSRQNERIEIWGRNYDR